jgi:DNA-binding transcriptional LysR family regulator
MTSSELADGLMRGRLDLAFLRPEPHMPALEYKVVTQEPIIVVMPSDHRLASRETIATKAGLSEGRSRRARAGQLPGSPPCHYLR